MIQLLNGKLMEYIAVAYISSPQLGLRVGGWWCHWLHGHVEEVYEVWCPGDDVLKLGVGQHLVAGNVRLVQHPGRSGGNLTLIKGITWGNSGTGITENSLVSGLEDGS